jgi:hypothetical protein
MGVQAMATPMIVESMTQVDCVGGLRVRAWRDEGEVKDVYDNSDVRRAVELTVRMCRGRANIREVALTLMQLERVSAVEVTQHGNGVVLYAEWP